MIRYILILIYFLIVETAIIYTINTGRKKLDTKKFVNLFLSIRVAKIILSFTFIGIYSLVVKTDIKNFALVFVLFHLCSTGFETWYFIRTEKRIKGKKEK